MRALLLETGFKISPWVAPLIIALAISSVIVGLITTKVVSKTIVEPAEELKEAASKIAKGDLNITVNYKGEDEFGELAEAFRKTCHTLKLIIDDLKYIMETGNFDESYYRA